MATVSITNNLSLTQFADGTKKIFEVQLTRIGKKVIDEMLSKEVKNGGFWVVNKDLKNSMSSITKWRTYIERPSATKTTLRFRNDTMSRIGAFNYPKRLIGKEYIAQEQGLTPERWLEFRERVKTMTSNALKESITKGNTSWIKGFSK